MSIAEKVRNKIKKFSEKPVVALGLNIKEEFERIIAPKRYKIPVFGNLNENNCLYVDFLFVSKYNKSFEDKPTQWKRKEPVRVYAKFVGKNENSKILFDTLESLNFSKNKKAQDVIVNHCVEILKDEIELVKKRSEELYRLIKKTDKNNQKRNIKRILLSIPFLIGIIVLLEILR